MVKVVDGDTVQVSLNGRRETVRYIGVDTPESVKPNTPVECFAKQASELNGRLVEGRKVRVVPGREPRDRYGRLLAYVYLADQDQPKTFVNAELVRRGYARTLAISPNTRFKQPLEDLEREAKAADRGLWGRC